MLKSPGCITASDIGSGPISGINTIEECLQLCLAEPTCVAVEYWADHGGTDAASFLPGDCILQSGGPIEDPTQPLVDSWETCNAVQLNLDLWLLCERSGNAGFLNAMHHQHACNGLRGMSYGDDPAGTDGVPCGPAELIAVVVGGAALAMCAVQDGSCECTGAVRYGTADSMTEWFDATMVEFCRNGHDPPSCGDDRSTLAVANAIHVAFCAGFSSAATCAHRYCTAVGDTCVPAVDSNDGSPPEWGALPTAPCNAEIFGDPAEGEPKSCQCLSALPDLSGYAGSSPISAVQIDLSMTSPMGCQQRCLATDGCKYFSSVI